MSGTFMVDGCEGVRGEDALLEHLELDPWGRAGWTGQTLVELCRALQIAHDAMHETILADVLRDTRKVTREGWMETMLARKLAEAPLYVALGRLRALADEAQARNTALIFDFD